MWMFTFSQVCLFDKQKPHCEREKKKTEDTEASRQVEEKDTYFNRCLEGGGEPIMVKLRIAWGNMVSFQGKLKFAH